MKIKNILAILSLGMVSCVGLEQYPTTSYTDETFWTIEDNVRTALYLGYNQCWHQDYYFANNLLSDDVYGSRHSTNETSIVTGMANTSNGRFSDEWDKCYQELRTIHTALDAQDRMNIDETFKTRMLAELRLMRAFTYLRLVTWFGDVPFFTTNPTLPESRVVKVTPAATNLQRWPRYCRKTRIFRNLKTDVTPAVQPWRSMHVHTFMTTISRTAPSGATS